MVGWINYNLTVRMNANDPPKLLKVSIPPGLEILRGVHVAMAWKYYFHMEPFVAREVYSSVLFLHALVREVANHLARDRFGLL